MAGRINWLAGIALAVLAGLVPAANAQDVPDFAGDFVESGGYEPVSAAKLDQAIDANLVADPNSVFRPGGTLSAPVKALMALETADGALPRVRLQIRLGMEAVAMPPAAAPVPVSFIEINRFNLGPAIRAELVAAHGADNVAPAESFGVGPHLSWRMVMQPEMGTAAMLVAAARAELGEADARARSCMGAPCLATAGALEQAAPWGEMAETALDLDVPFATVRDGLPTPAAAIAKLAGDMDFAPRPQRDGADWFSEAVVEVGLGQDSSLDAALVERELMDDSVAAIWKRLAAIGQGPGAGPMVFMAEAFECARGDEQFAAPGSFCP